MRIDLHVHTAYSYDCWMSLERVVKAARRNGLDGIAVIDHNEIEEAKAIARKHDIAVAAGSDAHFPWEIGRAGIEIAPFSTSQEFLENLRQAQIFGRRTPYIFAGLTYIIWCAHRLLKRS